MRQFAAHTLAHAESGLHAVIQRWGMALPLEVYFYNRGLIYAPLVKPSSWLEYLLCNKPGVLLGGFATSHPHVGDLLSAFWEAYRYEDPDHSIFRDKPDQLSFCVPYAFFTDEGRGLRKAPIQIVCLESLLDVSTLKWFQKAMKSGSRCDRELLWRVQRHTTRGSSLTSRFLLYALPHSAYRGKMKHVWYEVLKVAVEDLARLYHTGIPCEGKTWFPILVGVKGDAPALAKVGRLQRSFNHTVGNAGVCHHCLAGQGDHMWENLTSTASWLQTLYQVRPWSDARPSTVLPIPFSDTQPEKVFRSDMMHLVRLGIGRHFLASTIIAFGDYGVFSDGRSIDALFENAHRDFVWSCRNELKQTPNLKHFTREGFHWPRRSSYPWGGSWPKTFSIFNFSVSAGLLQVAVFCLGCACEILRLEGFGHDDHLQVVVAGREEGCLEV